MTWWEWFLTGMLVGAAVLVAATWGYVLLTGSQR